MNPTVARGLRAAVVVLLAVDSVAVGVALTDGGDRVGVAHEGTARASAAEADGRRFLDRYVDDDGRVVRHDQGGDSISEGQSYALLVAVALGDRSTFDRVWRWTVDHLQRDDDLLSWHWDGGVLDDEPAADADLDAAWALALASERWPDGAYRAAAVELAHAVAAHEVVPVRGGAALVAGRWATGDPAAGRPPVLNPSYASPVADAVLAGAGLGPAGAAEARRAGNRAVLRALVAESGVPPDWARLQEGDPVAAAGPDEAGPGRFGWDAVRVPLRFAPSCDRTDQEVAAALWPAIEAGAGFDVMGDHPARLVGAAAAAAAAGEERRAVALLDEAAAQQAAQPTYYGGALTALGRLLLTTDRLGGCPPVAAAGIASDSGR